MENVLENSLFVKKPEKFQELSESVIQFNSLYNGNNIVKDDIFSILANYARQKEESLELFRFPTKDDDFCALTCVQKGRIFVYINSWLPLSNQIFAAAHELYHIWCFIEDKDKSVLRKGSFLNAASMDDGVKNKEDREANAFAGMFLVPSSSLHEQMRIYSIPKNKPELKDIIKLMAIFSVPYKAILLRLYEESYLDVSTVERFLEIKRSELEKAVGYDADASRWGRRTSEICQTGSLRQLMEHNLEFDLLTDARASSDQKLFHEILHRHGSN